MKKKVNMCIFHTEFACSGGAEKVIFRQMDYFKKKGWQVRCFTAFIDEEHSYPELITRYDIQQVLPGFLNKVFRNDIMIVLTTILFPFSLFLYSGYDVFLGENQASTWWAYLAAKFFGKPFLTWMTFPVTITYQREIDKEARRNSAFVDGFLRLFRLPIVAFDRYVMKSARISLACGGYAQKILGQVYERKIINCPPGVERGIFNNHIFQNRLTGNINVHDKIISKPYILITNRHVGAKRLEWGIKILSQVKVNMVITGEENDYTKQLYRLAYEYKVQERVKFMGLVSENELKILYVKALVYVYTAPEEDFGMGILEAMAYGLPVVAWNKAGPRYIIKNGKTGYLIPSGDLTCFTERVRELLTNKEKNYAMAKEGYKESEKYLWEKHCRILEKEISNIV